MDTSETYIKMSGCEEVQGKAIFRDGEYVYFPSGDVGMMFDNYGSSEGYIWLPQQDQIQDMIEPSCSPVARLDLLWYLSEFVQHGDVTRVTSFEQLWLSFYMKEKHGKIWTGEKWDAV